MDQAVADGVPFFLYMAHYAVHVPFAEDKRFTQRYIDAGLDHIEAQYAALLEGMDKWLGDILDNLQRRGVADNTVVLFMSDNGGLSAHGRSGEPHTHNKPLSSGKGSAHEGGIREPMIARWPGVAREGTVCSDPLIIEDFFPTILEIAGAPAHVQPGGALDGVSFAPLLRGDGPSGARSLFWHYPNNWGPIGPGIGASSTIRRGDWKLIYYHADQRYELFDVASDLGETTNLARDKDKTRADLAAELREYLVGVNAQMPILRATGKQVPLPG